MVLCRSAGTAIVSRAQQADKPERRQTDGKTDTRELREWGRGRTRNTSGGINVISGTLRWRDANGSETDTQS